MLRFVRNTSKQVRNVQLTQFWVNRSLPSILFLFFIFSLLSPSLQSTEYLFIFISSLSLSPFSSSLQYSFSPFFPFLRLFNLLFSPFSLSLEPPFSPFRISAPLSPQIIKTLACLLAPTLRPPSCSLLYSSALSSVPSPLLLRRYLQLSLLRSQSV